MIHVTHCRMLKANFDKPVAAAEAPLLSGFLSQSEHDSAIIVHTRSACAKHRRLHLPPLTLSPSKVAPPSSSTSLASPFHAPATKDDVIAELRAVVATLQHNLFEQADCGAFGWDDPYEHAQLPPVDTGTTAFEFAAARGFSNEPVSVPRLFIFGQPSDGDAGIGSAPSEPAPAEEIDEVPCDFTLRSAIRGILGASDVTGMRLGEFRGLLEVTLSLPADSLLPARIRVNTLVNDEMAKRDKREIPPRSCCSFEPESDCHASNFPQDFKIHKRCMM